MSTTPSERTEQRRRLLKRAAAAPAIFVLPTGAALAASSSQCAAVTFPAGGPWTKDNLPAGGWVFEVAGTDQNGNTTYKLAKLVTPDGARLAPAVRSCWISVTGTTPGEDINGVLIP